MSLLRVLVLVAVPFALGVTSAQLRAAGLDWPKTRLELSATAGDGEVTAEFPFKNATHGPIEIVDVRTSCECTTATPSMTTVPPGESGVLHVVFEVGDRVGQQEKTIDVFTRDAPSRPAVLILDVKIAEVVVSQPRALIWSLGGATKEKVIEFTAAEPYKLRGLTPPGDTPGFRSQLEKVGDHRFRLRLTPLSTTAPMNGIFHYTAQVDNRPPLALSVYALVR